MHVNVTGSLALFARIFQLQDHPIEVANRPGARRLDRVDGAVAFDGVSFTYPTGARPALDEVSKHGRRSTHIAGLAEDDRGYHRLDTTDRQQARTGGPRRVA